MFDVHRHLTQVVLPDGTRLTAASFDPAAPYARARDPDYAVLAVLAGHPARGAVAWVRSHYCARAVETPGQEALAAAFASS